MINYASLAESASVILTIYFIAAGVLIQPTQSTGMLPVIVDAYRKWIIVVFIPSPKEIFKETALQCRKNYAGKGVSYEFHVAERYRLSNVR
jgi:hypothetical protein